MSPPDIVRCQGENLPLQQSNSQAKPMGRWSSLLLVLLLGGLAEAGLGSASFAQENGSGVAQNAQPVVIDPAKGSETVNAEEVAPGIVEAPGETPEVIVIPKGQESIEDSGDAETAEAIAPAAPEDPTAPEQAQPPEPDGAVVEASPTDANPEVDPTPLETETETAEMEAPERIYLAEKQISFVPPQGFTAMSPEEIQAKFPRDMPPKYVYANETRDVSVGITVSEIPLNPEQLPEVKAVLEDFLETSVPGFQWLEHDFVNLGGQDWIKLEFISQTEDQRIHNDMYITSLQGKLLGFNFNANLAVDFALRDQLQASRNSISLNETVASDDGLIP